MSAAPSSIGDLDARLYPASQAKRDASELASAGPARKAQELPAIPEVDPFAHPSPHEKLVGDLTGAFSR